MSTLDLDNSAERIRRVEAGESKLQVYCVMPEIKLPSTQQWQESLADVAHHKDAWHLAKAYLSNSLLANHKYLNAECGISGCQWLVGQHQADVYRKQMADTESELSRLRSFLDKCEAFLDCEGMASTSDEVAEVIERFVKEARA